MANQHCVFCVTFGSVCLCPYHNTSLNLRISLSYAPTQYLYIYIYKYIYKLSEGHKQKARWPFKTVRAPSYHQGRKADGCVEKHDLITPWCTLRVMKPRINLLIQWLFLNVLFYVSPLTQNVVVSWKFACVGKHLNYDIMT